MWETSVRRLPLAHAFFLACPPGQRSCPCSHTPEKQTPQGKAPRASAALPCTPAKEHGAIFHEVPYGSPPSRRAVNPHFQARPLGPSTQRTRPTCAARGGTVDIELWPHDADPGNAICPACHRAALTPSASAVLDTLLAANDAIGTAAQCLKILKDVVERSALP